MASVVATMAATFEQANLNKSTQTGLQVDEVSTNCLGERPIKGMWEQPPKFHDEQSQYDSWMSKSSFDMICEEVETTAVKKNMKLCDIILVCQCLYLEVGHR